ncbi:MAG: D-alanyl-D-alanine carboxypeptidase, partial [Clostridia bacterium]|nr:D-alanyl-D-alanine carboxypeptidase [Clostridia bacterium]
MRDIRKLMGRVLALVLACVFLASPAYAAYGEDCPAGEIPIPGCEAAYIVELTSGTVVYSDNANEKMFPASTTKLMTALLAIEYIEAGSGSLEDIIIFSEAAVYGIPRDTMHINISVGEKMTVEQVLYAILLPSANEACLGMAEYIAGDIENFIDLMNIRAEELGMRNTHYVTANGLHDEEHYTTAADMSILMQEVLKHDVLVRIMSTAEYELPATNMSLSRSLS